MQLATALPRLDLSPRRAPRRERERGSARRRSPHEQAKRAGGPQDRALYTCGCGYAFLADVSTSVGCPHCGTSQAW